MAHEEESQGISEFYRPVRLMQRFHQQTKPQLDILPGIPLEFRTGTEYFFVVPVHRRDQIEIQNADFEIPRLIYLMTNTLLRAGW